MDKNDYEIKKAYHLLKLFNELLLILNREDTGEISVAIKIIKNSIDILTTSLNTDQKNIRKTLTEVRLFYKSLYPPHGGLSDFFIWRDDFDERVKVNQPLESVQDEIWRLLELI